MANIFQKIPVKVPRSTNFNKSHEVLTSANFGDLIPIFCEYLNPGDRYTVTPELVCRMAPMVAPVFSRVNVFLHFFAVPIRLVDKKFTKKFINDNNADGTYQRPFINPSHYMQQYGSAALPLFKVKSLWDYFGFPTTADATGYNYDVVSDCFRAYQLIWNEYYRDQNLQTAVPLDPNFVGNELAHQSEATEDEAQYDPQQLLVLRQRCFEKDYFTSALPFTQRGEPVTIPLSGDANIYYDMTNDKPQYVRARLTPHSLLTSGLNGTTPNQDMFSALGSNSSGGLYQNNMDDNADAMQRLSTSAAQLDLNGTHKVDLSGVNASTINELRFAFALQAWLEANARAGARYKEQLMVHFGVIGKDARLDRPEFLGGVRVPLAISEVLSTSQTNSAVGDVQELSLGDMGGHGIGVSAKTCVRQYFADEHCLIIGIMSIMPRTAYSQGVRRQFTAFDFYDFPFPRFAHLGEQAVRNKEIFVSGDKTTDEGIFGYQSRYAEYKYIPSRVAGDFRDSLKYWHLGRFFQSTPSLNGQFVSLTPQNQTAFNRIFAVTSNNESHFYCYFLMKVHSRQELPRYGVPSL